jgi:hypothetical protein
MREISIGFGMISMEEKHGYYTISQQTVAGRKNYMKIRVIRYTPNVVEISHAAP